MRQQKRMQLSLLTSILLLSAILTCNKSPNDPGPADAAITPLDDGIITIGLYADNGAHASCVTAAEKMFQWLEYRVERIYAHTVNDSDLRKYDVIYFPGGSTSGYQSDITIAGREKIQRLVRGGGAFIGTCAGALFGSEKIIWEGQEDRRGSLALFPGTAIGPIPAIYAAPQYGMCQINLMKPHPITDSEPDSTWIMYYNGPYFVANTSANVTVIGNYHLTRQIALVCCMYGKGRVFLIGPHPEWEEDSSRDGDTFFDRFDDRGSDWPLMKKATQWCLSRENGF